MSQQLQLGGVTGSGAWISDCGRYRYSLHRRWHHAADSVCWIMLNPSTADAEQDDPTIRRCMRFAEGWGYGGIVIVNLFGWRATKPAVVRSLLLNDEASDPTGPRNMQALRGAMDRCPVIVAAWGSSLQPWSTERGQLVEHECLCLGKRLQCLGTTADGSPRHPLYVRGSQKLEGWPRRAS
jgi:hypothetical protein